MYCTDCGSENSDDARFCKSCGKTVTEPEPGTRGSDPKHPGITGPPTHVPNYLVPAILTTIFCCLPTGIVSIVYAARVNGQITNGDLEAAKRSSEQAKLWAWVSFGMGITLFSIFVVLPVLALLSFDY